MPDYSKNPQLFSNILLRWDRTENTRQMPWKNEKDPFKIWLSEIILQQTRVEQGLKYYNNFIKTFPGIHQLAAAEEKKVFKLWEGLGYYSRCRNLITTARYISKELHGRFPETYAEIRALKGIGPYTAAAISSFAFNLPYAVVDGNVFRVLSRIFGIYTPVDSTEGKKQFAELSNRLLDKNSPGLYNQAIMDFGAVICKPIPLCEKCVFRKNCFAFLNNKIAELPVKEKKITIKKRWFYYLAIECSNTIAVRQRTAKDVWQQLYELPVIETGGEQNLKDVLMLAEKQGLLIKRSYQIMTASRVYKQQLSHQLIAGQFLIIKMKTMPSSNNHQWLWLTRKQLKRYAFPKLINEYLSEYTSKTR